ncbi:hypothetical protein ABPG74_009233 [Tetrahymena malaccensis]
MCLCCFGNFKQCYVHKKDKSQLDLSQYRFKGNLDDDDFSSELVIDQDTYLLGLPTNDQELSILFQETLKSSIYYKLGEYFSAASTAFQSVQTYINSSDSLLALRNQVFSFLLISKDRIETYSNIPTYGIAIKDKIIQNFTHHIDDQRKQTFVQSYDITDHRKSKCNIIIFGNQVRKFKDVLLLSELTQNDYELKQQEQQQEICYDSIYNDTCNYLSTYFLQFEDIIEESYNPCGYIIKLQQ